MALTQADYAIIRSLIQAYATAPAPPTSGLLRPGTVTTYDSGTQQVGVVVDGDLAATMTLNLTGFHLPVGQRVMVTFQPPHGAFVVGLAQPTHPLLLSGYGSQGAPALAFVDNPDTGMYGGTNLLAFAVNGTNLLALYSTYAEFNGLNSVRFPLGSAAGPSMTFAGDADTGFFRKAANEIGISLGGAQRAYWGHETAGTGGDGGYTLHLSSGPPTTTGGSVNVYCASARNYALFIWISQRRYKRDIRDLRAVFDTGDWIDRLRPRVFKPRAQVTEDDPDQDVVGFVAEEVADVDPLLADYGEGGDEPERWNINAMVTLLVAEVQSLRRRVESLEAEVADLREGCCS